MTILIRSPFSEPANIVQAIQWEDSLRLMMPEHGSRNSSIGTILTITIVVSNFLHHTSVTVAKVKRYLRNDTSSMRLRKRVIRNAGHVKQGTGPCPMKCGLILKNLRLKIKLSLKQMHPKDLNRSSELSVRVPRGIPQAEGRGYARWHPGDTSEQVS